MQWLEKIRPPRFLRYIFYRMYKHEIRMWGKESASPIFSANIFFTITHFFQISFFYSLLGVFKNEIRFYIKNKIQVLVIMLILYFIVWLFYSYKNKHLSYIKEFENETKTEKRRSIIYLFIYLFISLSLFVGGLWLLTFNNPNYDHYKTDQQIEYQEEDSNPFEYQGD